jgi:hypothetical protein
MHRAAVKKKAGDGLLALNVFYAAAAGAWSKDGHSSVMKPLIKALREKADGE